MQRIIRILLTMSVVASCCAVNAKADLNGKTGRTTTGCGGCHGQQSTMTAVNLEGPRTVVAGTTKNYAALVGHPTHQYAGFNASFKSGTSNVGTLAASSTNCKVSGGEVTHTQPSAFNGGAARFEFTWTAPANAGTYTYTSAGNAVNNDGKDSDVDDWNLSGQIQIVVISGSITQPAKGATLCTGTDMMITWTQSGMSNVRLEMSTDDFQTKTIIATSVAASALTYTYAIPASLEPGTYSLRMIDVASTEVVSTITSIVINAGPAIVLQPEPTFVCSGKNLTLSVSAASSNVQYRWRKNGVDIAGGTKSVLTINTVTSNEAGTYDCVVYGCNTSVTSNAVKVTVGEKPTITTQPVAKTVCEGQAVEFSIAATGTDVTYTWKKNGGIVSDANGPKLMIPATTLFDEGDYSCLVEGACGPSATSSTVKLSVIEKPSVRTEPVDKNLKEGDTLLLSVVAAGELLKYQWYKDGAVLAADTSATLRKLKIAKADSGLYQCRVWNACDTLESRVSTVKIVSITGPGKFVLSTTELALPSVPSCAVIDTTIKGLLINEGGAPVTITSVSAEPIANISVEGVVAPFNLEVNERRDIRLKITPKKNGVFECSVTFFASSGNQTFRIAGDAVTGLSVTLDTLIYTPGTMNVKKCNITRPLPCAATNVTKIKLSGPGAGTWKNATDRTLPFAIAQNQQTEFCFESTAETGDDAMATITTDNGDVTFVLTRKVVSSVDELDDQSAIRVFPNPMSDDLFIRGGIDEQLRCTIRTVAGSHVASLKGRGEIVWTRRDSNGELVPAGLYLIVIEHGAGTTVQKVLVR